jgi:CRP-like cAMP-binding protein
MSDLGIFEKRQIKPRQVITRRGDPGKRIYLLLEGSVQTSGAAAGSEVLGSGAMFGRVDLLTGEDAGAYAETTTSLTEAILLFADANQLVEEFNAANPTIRTLLRTTVKALG